VALKQCLESIRKYYPDISIIVITDAKLTNSSIQAIHKAQARLYILEHDAGLSQMRNKGIREAQTPCVMVMEDDMIFLAETGLERLKAVLNADSRIALVAGGLIYGGEKKAFINRLDIRMKNKEYEILPIKNPAWLKTKEGVKYCYADYMFNFFLLRKAAGLNWDNDLKIGIEHVDFFIRLKINHPQWKAACVPSVIANHKEFLQAKKYRIDRKRNKYWQVFHNKTGFARGINLNAKIIYDFKGNRMLPYPEYVFYLLNNKINVSREALTTPIQPAHGIGG
jgi:hypothetical protein